MNEVELNAEFVLCLKKFPELVLLPRLLVEWTTDELAGALGHDQEDIPVIVLMVPERMRHLPSSVVRPILFHELAHMTNLEHPDKVFYERADPLCVDLWKRMQADGLLSCSHPEKGQDK